jgi:hypothetical protein
VDGSRHEDEAFLHGGVAREVAVVAMEVFSGQNPMALKDDGTATFKYAGAENVMKTTSDGAVEVTTNGTPSLRYRKDSDMLIIEDLRSGETTVMPLGEARARADRALAY